MPRSNPLWSLLAVLITSPLTASAQTPDCVREGPLRLPRDFRSRLAWALEKPFQFNGFADPKTTLLDALDDLARHHNVTFDINEEAFKRDGIRNVGSIKVAETPIPKMANTRLSEVLPMILAQVPAPSGATFFIHFDAIEITTRKEVTCSYLDEIRYRMKIITSLADPFDPPVKDVCSLIAEIAEWKAALTDRVRPIAMRKDAESLTK